MHSYVANWTRTVHTYVRISAQNQIEDLKRGGPWRISKKVVVM